MNIFVHILQSYHGNSNENQDQFQWWKMVRFVFRANSSLILNKFATNASVMFSLPTFDLSLLVWCDSEELLKIIGGSLTVTHKMPVVKNCTFLTSGICPSAPFAAKVKTGLIKDLLICWLIRSFTHDPAYILVAFSFAVLCSYVYSLIKEQLLFTPDKNI